MKPPPAADGAAGDKARLAEDDRGGLVVGTFDLAGLAAHRPGLPDIAAALGLAQKFVILTAVAQGAIESEAAGLIGARAKLSDRRILKIHPRRVSLRGIVRGAIDVGMDGVRLSFLAHRTRTDCAHGTAPFLTTGATAVLQTAQQLPSADTAPPRKLKEMLADILGMSDADVAVTVCGLAAATVSSKAAIAAVTYEALVLLREQLPSATAVALARQAIAMLLAPGLRTHAPGTLGPEIHARALALARITGGGR